MHTFAAISGHIRSDRTCTGRLHHVRPELHAGSTRLLKYLRLLKPVQQWAEHNTLDQQQWSALCVLCMPDPDSGLLTCWPVANRITSLSGTSKLERQEGGDMPVQAG
jgi:hypothetical protein